MILRVPVDVGESVTAWVRLAATAINQLLSRKLLLVAVDDTYTVADGVDVVTGDTTSAAFTITLPKAAPNASRVIYVKRIDASANNLTVDGDGSETIDGAATTVLTSQWETRTLFSDGSNWLSL